MLYIVIYKIIQSQSFDKNKIKIKVEDKNFHVDFNYFFSLFQQVPMLKSENY